MTNTFTTKEMLVRIMDKMDNLEVKLEATHATTLVTNGKVKLHTKMLWGLAGTGLTVSLALFGLIIKNL